MKDKDLNLLVNADYDFDEVVDSIADLMEAGIIVEEALDDGFQFQDILAVLQVQPKVQEIINDLPVFLDQFVKLNGDTAIAAVVQARDRILAQGKAFGVITKAVIKFLFVAANNYKYAEETYARGLAQFTLWKTLLSGGDIFPD